MRFCALFRFYAGLQIFVVFCFLFIAECIITDDRRAVKTDFLFCFTQKNYLFAVSEVFYYNFFGFKFLRLSPFYVFYYAKNESDIITNSFWFLFLRVHERQIISLSYIDISKPFCGGVLQKFLLPHYNWKVTSRLSGYFTKILQKNCREIFPTTAYKKEVRYYSNFLLLFWLFRQIIFDTSVSRSIRNIDSETVYL